MVSPTDCAVVLPWFMVLCRAFQWFHLLIVLLFCLGFWFYVELFNGFTYLIVPFPLVVVINKQCNGENNQ